MAFDSPSRQQLPRQPRFDKSPLTLAQSSFISSQLQQTPKRQPSKSLGIGTSPLFKTTSKPKTPLKMDVVTSDWVPTGNATSRSGTASILGSPSKSNKSTGRLSHADRFIPNRQASLPVKSKLDKNGNDSSYNGSNSSLRYNGGDGGGTRERTEVSTTAGTSSASTTSSGYPQNSLAYQSSVAEACGIALNTRILEFQPAAPHSTKPIDLRSQYNRPLKPAVSAQMRRKVPTAPERVLDAPGLIDDYYLNLLDWSSGNQVAIALERSVYIWNASSGSVSSLMESSDENYVSGIKWSGDGAYLSIGFSDGDIEIWDVEEQSIVRSMNGHAARVGVMSWDRHIMSSGCRDGSIWNHDVRLPVHKVSEMNNHTGEVCGLEWRSDGAQLASGGNDNVVNIWDARSTAAPKFSKTNHRAAVRALAWCPWQLNLLSSGGGSQDKYIHFWNSTTGARVNSLDTGSQVTSIRWSTAYKELVSTHGFPENHITIWNYPSMTKQVEIVGHDSRVLHSALSPDGQTLATCASDENLKFWKLFESLGQKVASGVNGTLSKDVGKVMMIR